MTSNPISQLAEFLVGKSVSVPPREQLLEHQAAIMRFVREVHSFATEVEQCANHFRSGQNSSLIPLFFDEMMKAKAETAVPPLIEFVGNSEKLLQIEKFMRSMHYNLLKVVVDEIEEGRDLIKCSTN